MNGFLSVGRQRTKNKEQRTKNKEQRTKNKEQTKQKQKTTFQNLFPIFRFTQNIKKTHPGKFSILICFNNFILISDMRLPQNNRIHLIAILAIMQRSRRIHRVNFLQNINQIIE